MRKPHPIAAGLLAILTAGLAAQDPPPQPVFRAATELIAIDATVIDDRGRPIDDLTIDDFEVTVDGRPRRVVSAEYLSQEPSAAGAAPLPSKRLGYSTNQGAQAGRLILLAFDEESISASLGHGAAQAARRFVDQLAPTDRIGVVALPNGARLEFTADREAVARTLQRVVGRSVYASPTSRNIGLAEALDIDRGDQLAYQRAVDRECTFDRDEMREVCERSVLGEARMMTVTIRQRAQRSLMFVRTLLTELAKVDAPKTVVWISEGVALDESRVETSGLSMLASRARTTIYSLHLDRNAFADASVVRPSPTTYNDRQLMLEGLATIAGASRGAVYSTIGLGDDVFARIAREMTAYYLLSVEPIGTDRDGQSHRVKVAVKRDGLTVRARREFAMGSTRVEPESDEQRVAGMLRAPLLASELPLKVATYSLRDGADRVRVLISTELGAASTNGEAAIGVLVTGPDGKIVSSVFQRAEATLLRPGEPGPLHTVTAIAVPPGSYNMRVAVLDPSGRGGSVEHTFDARVAPAGPVQLADLLLAPALDEAGAFRPAADATVDGDAYLAYLEIYAGDRSAFRNAAITIEIADDENAPALATTSVPFRETRDRDRAAAQAPLPLDLLPPGEYVARATVSVGGQAAGRRSRWFRLERAATVGTLFADELRQSVGPFDVAAVLDARLVQPALDLARSLDGDTTSPELDAALAHARAGEFARLASASGLQGAGVTPPFLRGLGLLQTGKLEEAATAFRASVRASPDFMPGIFYLGSCYAAGGKMREAVGAWQTSLAVEEDAPLVYALLADGLLRLDDEAAGEIIEEARAKWPDEFAFVQRAVLATAAAGRPAEALADLRPWLDRGKGDAGTLRLALRLAIASAAANPSAAAIEEIRDLSRRHDAAGGPPLPLVARWIAYLEKPS